MLFKKWREKLTETFAVKAEDRARIDWITLKREKLSIDKSVCLNSRVTGEPGKVSK